MQSRKIIHTVSCHAEGEVGDVIVGGVAVPPGDTLWEQSRWIATDKVLRNFMLNEPRGGVFHHVNLLVPPKHPDAQMGWIIMEPEDTPPMSGSNSICVATVLLETGILPMEKPEWTHISFCQMAAPLRKENHVLVGKNTVVIQPGKLDRSPTGTGCSARMAVLARRGMIKPGDAYIGESIIGSRFHCRLESSVQVGDFDGIVPSISGRAWVTGTHQHMLDPQDPWPQGYQVADTWPKL